MEQVRRDWRAISKTVMDHIADEDATVVPLDDWEGDYPVERFEPQDEPLLVDPPHPKAVRKFMWEHQDDPVLSEEGAAIFVSKHEDKVYVGYGSLRHE